MKIIKNYLPFFVLFLLPLFFYHSVDTSGWRSSSDVHAFLEFAASLLAITAGLMVLLHFFTTGRWFFLIISIGFVLIGTEEFVHAIFSFERIWPEIPPTFKLAISSTWLTGRFTLVTSFLIALLFGEKEIAPAKRGLTAVVCNIIGLTCAAFVTLLIFNSPHVPDFVQLGSITKKLLELSLALLFFVVFLFYSNIYFKQQSHSPLLWSIIACIIFQVLVHIFVFDSQAFYDSHWDTAHLIICLSYFFPIYGVWGETIKLHKSAQAQVIELEKEMSERKRVEEALQEGEKHFHSYFMKSPVGINGFDSEGKVIAVNSIARKYFGVSEDDPLTGYRLFEDPSISEETKAKIRNGQIATEERFIDFAAIKEHRMYRTIKTENDRVYIHLTYTPYGPINNPTGYIVIIQDITERKQAEEKIRESEEKYRNLFNNAEVGMFRTRLDGSEILEFNERYLKTLGYTFDEVKGKPSMDMWADKRERDRVVKLLKTEGQVTNFECGLLNKQGEVITCITSLLLYRDVGILEGSIIDITDRKQAEEALRAAQQIIEGIINAIPARVFWKDKNLVFLGCNAAFARDAGFVDQKDIIGKDDYKMVWRDQAELYRGDDRQVIESGHSKFFIEEPQKTPEGNIITLLTSKVPLYNSKGEISGVLGTYMDITERKRIEEELRASRFQLRAFATRLQQIREDERIMIAREIHDEMGGGLTGLKMDLSWLLHKMGDADPDEERVALMEKIRASNMLIDQMIKTVRRVATDLRPSVLDDLGLIAALEWQLSEFTSRTEIPHELVKSLDYVNLENKTATGVFRIFQEALTNVVRHSQATKVTVVLREGERSLFGDEGLVLEIRDNGRGITEEEILNQESLGLLGMKERVLAFGGGFSIRGEPGGGGTSVILKIPRIQGEPS